METYLYVAPNLGEVVIVNDDALETTTDRHRVALRIPPLRVCLRPLDEMERQRQVRGVIIGMERGWPGSSHLRFAARVLRAGRRVWFYWPGEDAVECLDRERISSYWNLWTVIAAYRAKRRVASWFSRDRPQQPVAAPPSRQETDPGPELVERCTAALQQLVAEAEPVPFERVDVPDCRHPIEGVGAYLRTDYWARLSSGGSYGHTCYVAKELAAVTERFIALTAQRYTLLDELGLHQLVMPLASESSTEAALLAASWHYYPILKIALEALRPAYLYERLVLGNFAGALLSRELRIPYIVEYNGSEISMSRSFGGNAYQHENLFTLAEDAAFRQATMITVVSLVIKESLAARGVDARKILVNPNGADPAVYAPPAADRKHEIRTSLGFGDEDRVIGFSGTFGGWHGIDVLAAAIPQVCDRNPRAKFLLIGDGSHKPQLDQAIATHNLDGRVRSVGRVPQAEGARLLSACDLFVSPHNSHMVDSRFFGSPTKLFEYMAMGGGVIASELEQLGEVLSPALRVPELLRPGVHVTDQRAVLCTPGEAGEFTAAVVALADRPDVAAALGRNARQAVLDKYSWQRHVQNVWHFAITGSPAVLHEVEPRPAEPPLAETRPRVETGDAYKEEVQNQWNHNPVGPQYVKATAAHTLEWFQEIEAHRYHEYAPWMQEVMEFSRHSGEAVLDIGGGIGTDLSQFARHGARVTDVDLSSGHLELARENFALRGLSGRFVHHDAEDLPFDDNAFDVVYSNGVLHHTPNTRRAVSEVYRVLKPGGLTIVMMYAENSLHYWSRLVWELGLEENMLKDYSIGEIMSRHVELTKNDAKPLVKVYSARRLRALFSAFRDITILKRQLTAPELPDGLRWMPLDLAGKLMGWNLIIKARKPQSA
jgi:glycosyltransferase involved in cell wall biosynthesis/ubiquinone/menaquinone biosynthesis C-methylase UbiE